MIFVTPDLIGVYIEANKKYKLDEVINVKKFTVSDTPLSYRQANSLDEDKLLDSKRKSKSGWRKFSYKELIYFEIIITLKKFGIKQEQLLSLWESFFKELPNKKQVALRTKADAEMAIYCVFAGIEMTLIVDIEGNAFFSDPKCLTQMSNSNSHIRISLNEIVNRLNPKIGFKPILVEHTMQNYINNRYSFTTDKEQEVLRIIREKDYSVIKVKKKNGEISIVYAERNKEAGEITPSDLLKILQTKDFMNLAIVQRGGKIVNYYFEETIKL